MKIISMILLLGLIISCTHLSGRNPSNAESSKPRHLIITVHGLSGDATTWGHFSDDNYTKKYLEELNPQYQVETKNFVYATGESEKKGAWNFADDLGKFINKQFADRPLGPNDKISFVCHSQGGLVTFIWFFKNIMDGTITTDDTYIKHVDSIITLGTPFWGSKIATMLTEEGTFDVFPFIQLLGMKATRHEVSDMAFGSDTISLFRRLAIEIETNPELVKKIEALPFRLINISGVLPKNKNELVMKNSSGVVDKLSDLSKNTINLVYSLFKKLGFGGEKYVESDVAVIVPSSRWDFIYAQPQKIYGNNSTMTEPYQIDAKDFHHFANLENKSRVLFVETVHLPLTADSTYSMANITENCVSPNTCQHPTYRYILEHLSNCKKPESTRNTAPFYQVDCNPEKYTEIIANMKSKNQVDQASNKAILSLLRAYTIQMNIKLDIGYLHSLPFQYFKQTNSTDPVTGQTTNGWTYNTDAFVGKIVDLKYDKNQASIASMPDFKIIIGDKKESHSVDIVAKEFKPQKDLNRGEVEDPHEYLRIFITGYVDGKAIDKLPPFDANGRPNPPPPFTVPISLNLPGMKPVKLNVMAQPSYSTFLELDYTRK